MFDTYVEENGRDFTEYRDDDIFFAIDPEEKEFERGIRDSMKGEYAQFMRSFYGFE